MRYGYIALAFGLSACSGGGIFGGDDAPDMPSYFLNAGFEIGMAQTTAEVCSSVDFKDERATARQQAVAEQLVADGHTADELRQWQASPEYKEWAEARTLAYFNEKGIPPEVNLGEASDDACRIADEEIAAESGIGRLLEKV